MSEYKFTEEVNKAIVNGLVDGYGEYLRIREDRQATMKISGAYAWVKGNHIDDKIAVQCEDKGISSQLALAGVAWQYLKFNDPKTKSLFIVRNGRYFNKDDVARRKNITGDIEKNPVAYMKELIKINKDIDFEDIELEKGNNYEQLEIDHDVQLTIEDIDNIKELESDFNSFYIITYELDQEHQISSIKMFMPNPKNGKAYEIEDLTKYIESLPVFSISESLKDALSNANKDISAEKFGIQTSEGKEEEG